MRFATTAFFFLLAEIGFADFGGACGASFHFAPTMSKEKAANETALFNELLFYPKSPKNRNIQI